MLNISFGSNYTANITLPENPDSDINYKIWVSLFYEWGDLVQSEEYAGYTSFGKFYHVFSKDQLNACGVHRIHWRYIINNIEYTKDVYVNVYQPYISASEFFSNHPELEERFGDSFDNYEKTIKKLIDTYCGQKFENYSNKTLSFDGQESRTLYLSIPLRTLTKFVIYDNPPNVPTTETDFTPYVEIASETNRAVRMKNPKAKISKEAYVKILGDWGWEFVPQNISLAADILIMDRMNDDSNYRLHGVQMVHMDQYRLTMFDGYQGSTGNLDADVLLMDYTIYTLGWV